MKKDGKYRYSLQFGSDSEEEIKAGELLERLGNRKSVVIVAALNDYIEAHPNLQNPQCKIEIKTDSGYNRAKIESLVRAIVEEKLGMVSPDKKPADVPDKATVDLLEEDVAQMLDNLDMFL